MRVYIRFMSTANELSKRKCYNIDQPCRQPMAVVNCDSITNYSKQLPTRGLIDLDNSQL